VSKHGGKREGAGRHYSPWDRISLAQRYAELRHAFVMAGDRAPIRHALEALHAELGADISTIRKLVRRGLSEDILDAENDPWFVRKLEPARRRLQRWLRHRYHRET
jgi:hypothetical protein